MTAPTDANFKVRGTGEPINGQNLAVTFTITYSAIVTEGALINNPLENTNTLHYGNNPGYTPEPGDNEPPEFPNVTEITVNKSFTNGPTADSTAIEWPAGLEITFQLQVYNPVDNTWSDVTGKTLTLNSTTQSGKFTDLDATKVYKAVEVAVTGWVPNYSVNAQGQLVVVNKKNDNPPPITPPPVTVRTGEKKFVKTNLDGNERLAGAEFVVIKKVDGANQYLALKSDGQIGTEIATYQAAETAYITAINAYNVAVEKGTISTENPVVIGGTSYSTAETAQAAIDALKTTRDNTYAAMNMQWTWVNSEDDAFKFVTNQEGQWEVKGLAYGDYFYKETKAPAGYAEQTGEVGFTVDSTSNTTGDISYTPSGTTTDATKITNKKVTIPQTGGRGTVIFTVVGLALMATALVMVKKNNREEA